MKFTRTNRLMDECLQELEAFMATRTRNRKLKGEILGLTQLALSPIVVHRGCYLLRYALPKDWRPDPEGEFIPDRAFPDRSGYEDYENHVHVMDLTGLRKPGIHHLAVGLAVAEILRLKLWQGFPENRFCLSVSFPVRPIVLEEGTSASVSNASIKPRDEDDTAVRDDCVVRFHAVRAGEVIYGDLAAFHFDAVGVLEI